MGKHKRCWALSLDRDLLSYPLKIPFVRCPHKTQASSGGHTGKTKPELGHIRGQQDRGRVVKSIVE